MPTTPSHPTPPLYPTPPTPSSLNWIPQSWLAFGHHKRVRSAPLTQFCLTKDLHFRWRLQSNTAIKTFFDWNPPSFLDCKSLCQPLWFFFGPFFIICNFFEIINCCLSNLLFWLKKVVLWFFCYFLVYFLSEFTLLSNLTFFKGFFSTFWRKCPLHFIFLSIFLSYHTFLNNLLNKLILLSPYLSWVTYLSTLSFSTFWYFCSLRTYMVGLDFHDCK